MSNSEQFSIHFININSYSQKKKLQVKSVLNNRQPHILALAETHLSNESKMSVKVMGYIPYNFPHTDNSSGLLVYVRNDLCSNCYSELSTNRDGSMVSFIDVCTNTITIRVGVVYIRPQAGSNTVKQIMADLKSGIQNRVSVVVGDFNLRSKEWGDSVTSSHTRHLNDFCLANHFSVLNKSDAFATPTRGDSILDLALTNQPMLFSLKLCAIDLTSDHSPVSVFSSLNPPPSQSRPNTARWNSSKANWSEFSAACKAIFPAVHDDLVDCLARANSANQQDRLEQATRKFTAALEEAARAASIPCNSDSAPQARMTSYT